MPSSTGHTTAPVSHATTPASARLAAKRIAGRTQIGGAQVIESDGRFLAEMKVRLFGVDDSVSAQA